MSSGFGPIAFVELTNGTLALREVWGGYAPDDRHSVELTVRYSCQHASAGNVHLDPHESTTEVFLTRDQLRLLSTQLRDYAESLDEFERTWPAPTAPREAP